MASSNDELAAALLALVEAKICGQSIYEVFTIECDSDCDNQARVYTIVEAAFHAAETQAETYIIRKLSQTHPLRHLLEQIGVYTLVANLSDDFAQAVINRFPLSEVVGSHSCDSNEVVVSFDDVVFIIDSYAIDEYGCLTTCKSLPWPLAEYEEVFGSSSDTCSTASGATGEENILAKINAFLNGRTHH